MPANDQGDWKQQDSVPTQIPDEGDAPQELEASDSE
jgi:hypothetical protein